jgi:hypothetical protein
MDNKIIQQLAEEILKKHLGEDHFIGFRNTQQRRDGGMLLSDILISAMIEMFEAGASDKGLVLKDGLIEYIYDFAWHYGRLFHLGSAEKIKQAIQEYFQLPEEWLEEAPASQLKWVNAAESLDRLPLEKFLHIRDNVGCKRLGNFFKEDGEIKLSICGTEMYPSFIIPQKDLWSIEWLEEAPSPTPLADWSVLAKIAPPEKWIEMYQHYQELLIAADTAAFWKEQFDIANAERNVLKQEGALVLSKINQFITGLEAEGENLPKMWTKDVVMILKRLVGLGTLPCEAAHQPFVSTPIDTKEDEHGNITSYNNSNQ